MQVDYVGLRKLVHADLVASPLDDIGESEVQRYVLKHAPLISRPDAEKVITEVLADISGLGVLQPLLSDHGITDVMVVGNRGVWVERRGRVIRTDIEISQQQVERLIERIVAPLGLRVDRSSPMVDARLPDGSRVNAIVPPLAVDGACLTIRRFGARAIGLAEIAAPPVARLLADAVEAHQNILVSGATGAGKTTLLNAMAGLINEGERVITVEDAAELRLPIRHVVRLEGRPANSEGVGQITLRELVKNALRMRPDRIIVGEIRGPEALDMLQAMNTGHEGSMSTCHANTPIDALTRVETMVLMGEVALPLSAVRQQILSSIDLVVQIARTADGGRAVVDVSEVGGTQDKLAVRQLADHATVLASPARPARRRRVVAA